MLIGKTDHIVFYCNNINLVRKFYEVILEAKAQTVLEDYVTYELGTFLLCFKKKDSDLNYGESVAHIGISFSSRAEVDKYFYKIKNSGYETIPSEIFGGPGQGPYRFYIKDPSGYTLEFESWEDCSD